MPGNLMDASRSCCSSSGAACRARCHREARRLAYVLTVVPANEFWSAVRAGCDSAHCPRRDLQALHLQSQVGVLGATYTRKLLGCLEASAAFRILSLTRGAQVR